MDNDVLHHLLNSVAQGRLSVSSAALKLRHIAYEDIDYAHVDHHRSLRKGFPEVIFGEGKTADQVIGIMDKMKDQENVILVTRLEQIKADKVVARFPHAVYHPDASMIVCEFKKSRIVGRGNDCHHISRHIGYTDSQRSLSDCQGHGQPGGNHFRCRRFGHPSSVRP